MKKRFLSVLLTLFMVLMMLPTTAYADSTWCDTCNKRVTVRYEYEYKDAQWHWNHTYCQECGKNTSNPRTKHQWSGTATCTSGRICTICGGTSNPLGHNYESSVTTKPTCTTDGVRTYVCKNDSSHTYTEPIPTAGHNYESSVTTEATCTTNGLRTYVCKNDSSHTYTEPIPAAGHNYESSVTIKPTCTTDGVRTYVCKNDSSHTYTEPIPAAHDWNSIWFSDENNHWHECNVCAEMTDVGEHIWNSGVITTSPTCTTAGEKTYTCSACERKKTEVISATGHDLKAIEKKEASCTEDGYEAYWRCQTCGKIFSDEAGTAEIGNPTAITATGHSYGVVTYTWSADNRKCTAERKCTVCDDAESETADATATVVQEKSCTLPELTTYSVTFGNSAFGTQTKENVQTAEATSHDLKAVKKKDAGCTEDGHETYWRCQTCKKLFSDEAGTVEIINPTAIKATGHNLEKVEKKDAGCTEDGHETYWRCQTCKKLFSDEAGTVEIINPTAIKATGHNLKKVEKKDATATEEGNSTYWFCDKCNKYFSDAKAETEIKKEDTVLAKLSTVNKKETEASSAKTANATKVTSTTDKTTKSSPKTGDSTDVQLYVILMLVSIGAAAGAGAKRKLKTQR